MSCEGCFEKQRERQRKLEDTKKQAQEYANKNQCEVVVWEKKGQFGFKRKSDLQPGDWLYIREFILYV